MPNLNDAPLLFIIDPDRGYTEWGLWEIFNGTPDGGKWVPNVDDAVRDWTRGILRVASVDYTTGLSTLVEWEDRRTPNEISSEDILLGVGPGYQSESWRVYYDTRTMPYTLDIDGRYHIYPDRAAYIKIFKGTEIGPSGVVIGKFFDQSGTFLGENIPMTDVTTPDPNHSSVKVPAKAYTTENLNNGSTVTVVVYSHDGTQLDYAKFLIYNSSLTRPLEAGLKYITGIRMDSPWLNQSDPSLLEFPMNINVDSVAMMGVVEYSDNTERRMPISQSTGRFSIFGLESFIPTNEGQVVRLTLNYKPENNERSYIQGMTFDGSIVERYNAKTTRVNNAYSLKLYVYPTWKGPITGWDLEFFLYNLDRQVFYAVPKSLVEVDAHSPNFDGHDYLTIQKLVFSVNLKQIDPQYNEYRHVQTVSISLKAQGTERRTNWTVSYDNETVYGEGLKASTVLISANLKSVRIDNGIASREEWLQKLYLDTKPLYDTWREPGPVMPNYYAIKTRTMRYERSIDEWQQDVQVTNDLGEGETLYVEWIYRTTSGDLQLGISGLTCHPIA